MVPTGQSDRCDSVDFCDLDLWSFGPKIISTPRSLGCRRGFNTNRAFMSTSLSSAMFQITCHVCWPTCTCDHQETLISFFQERDRRSSATNSCDRLRMSKDSFWTTIIRLLISDRERCPSNCDSLSAAGFKHGGGAVYVRITKRSWLYIYWPWMLTRTLNSDGVVDASFSQRHV